MSSDTVSKGDKVFRNTGKTILRAAWETNSRENPNQINVTSSQNVREAAQQSLSATMPSVRVSILYSEFICKLVLSSVGFTPIFLAGFSYELFGQLACVLRPHIHDAEETELVSLHISCKSTSALLSRRNVLKHTTFHMM